MRVEKGFLWPEEDQGMIAVAFTNLPDLECALGYVEKFDVCVQAGGNVGVWPKYLSDRFAYVYTFEPEPENFHYLCQNVPGKHVYKFPCGLGNGGVGTIIQNRVNIGAGKMIPGGRTPILRIDDLSLPACDFIQLDIEGMELEALRGARITLRKFKPVLMLEDKGLGPGVSGFLGDMGYKIMQKVNSDIICVS